MKEIEYILDSDSDDSDTSSDDEDVSPSTGAGAAADRVVPKCSVRVPLGDEVRGVATLAKLANTLRHGSQG